MSEPVIVTDPRIDSEGYLLDGVDTSKKPRFTVTEASKMFFGKSAHWIRWREREGDLTVGGDEEHDHHFDEGGTCIGTNSYDKEGRPTGKKRGSKPCGAVQAGYRRTEGGARLYYLEDIEKMAHAMATNGAINGRQLNQTLLLVKTSAQMYGYL